jgi:hypothetical protein
MARQKPKLDVVILVNTTSGFNRSTSASIAELLKATPTTSTESASSFVNALAHNACSSAINNRTRLIRSSCADADAITATYYAAFL